jgi:hypothetical protein
MEFASIVNKIDSQWPHSEKLKMLLDPSTSLDSVFDAICIPVLLTYESEVVRAHKQTTSEYVCEFVSEVTMHHATFKSRSAHLPPLRICLFLVPLKSKGNLQKELDRALKRWQKI